ncbi:MFS transporter [Pseudomassariella vexata]|uniref:MFS transporter n=1 Tax=Pseudomassariella vexata TaxID=1141098 RepID=A0A1Y2EBY7_9PEZI|nr:MFS transporter [Pseudomassariella vexata]ORY69071.1 MFS transporter [Pseudomassariella vexata]
MAANGDAKPLFVAPNGGRKAWTIVLGSFLLQSSSYGYVSACGVFQLYYKTVLLPGYSSQELGWITTVAVCLIFGACLPMGHIVDLYGIRAVTGPSAALGVASIGLLSLCTKYWQILLCQGFALGLACSGTMLPAVICVTQWFSSKRGLAVGMASAGGGFGGVIYPIMVARLIDQHGFSTAVKWSTLPMGFGMIFGVLLCESPFPARKARERAEQQKRLQEGFSGAHNTDAGQITESKDGQEGVDLSPAAQGSDSEDLEQGRKPGGFLKSLRHNGAAWACFAIGAFFCMFSLLSPLNYLPEMAQEAGTSLSLSQYTLSIINAGQMFGRVLPGWLSDHAGPLTTMAMVSGLSAIAMLVIWLPLDFYPNFAGIIFFAAFYGLSCGGCMSLASPCVVALADGRVHDLGAKMGIACMFMAIGSLVGVPVIGVIKESTNSFDGLTATAGATMAIGGVLFFISRVKLGGWKLLHKV